MPGTVTAYEVPELQAATTTWARQTCPDSAPTRRTFALDPASVSQPRIIGRDDALPTRARTVATDDSAGDNPVHAHTVPAQEA